MTPTLLCIADHALPGDLMRLPIKAGCHYPEERTMTCTCGRQYVDVGYKLDSDQHDFICTCKKRYNDGTWWFCVNRFRRMGGQQQQPRQMEITFTETVTRSVTIRMKDQ